MMNGTISVVRSFLEAVFLRITGLNIIDLSFIFNDVRKFF